MEYRDKSPQGASKSISNHLDLSQYTDHQDSLKSEILKQIRELEQNVDWQLYDA